MTVEEYTNKFVKLSRFVTSAAMDEVYRTRRYEKNRAPKDRTAVASQKKQKFEPRLYAPRDQGQAKKDMVCFRCGKAYHPGTICAPDTPITCFTCKALGHKAVDCPQKPKVEALKTGRVFVMSRAEADANPDVVVGTFFVHSLSAFGVRVTPTVKWVSAMKMVSLGRKGHQIYLYCVQGASVEPKLEDIPMAKEFPDMNRTFSEYLEMCVVVFIDVILIYSKDEAEHERHLYVILETLRKKKWYSMFSKCEFWLKEVTFLGHVIYDDGVLVDPSKIRAVAAGAGIGQHRSSKDDNSNHTTPSTTPRPLALRSLRYQHKLNHQLPPWPAETLTN
ncbi:uncharacterized protein LOC141651912 [Silene latifolia]|uniref:uncharacterized protein LOC141651912 n=1 Tax=Silene latifolia TaxID=37657 RepID=UPI003D77282C